MEPSTDLVIEATSEGFEQFFVLHERPQRGADVTFPLTVSTDGTPIEVMDDGSLSIQTSDGTPVATAPTPFMWDADSDNGRAFPITKPRPAEDANAARLAPMPDFTGEGPRAQKDREEDTEKLERPKPVGDGRVDPHQDAVEVPRTLEQVAPDTVAVELAPSQEFLQAPDTVYPVVVDPPVTFNLGFDTYVHEPFNNDRSGEAELRVGNSSNGRTRSFLNVPMGPIQGREVLEAHLLLFESYSWSCQPRPWQVWDTGLASTATGWANMPASLGASPYATSDDTTGYGSACEDDWVSADITSLAQRWAGSPPSVTEAGIGLTAQDESDVFAYKRFSSGNAGGNVPTVWFHYNYTPNVPSGLAISNTPVPTASSSWVSTLTPELSAHISDPDGGNADGQLVATFKVQTGEGGHPVWEGVVEKVTNASNPRIRIPAGLLKEDTVYVFTVTAKDATAYSAQASWFWFRTDTLAPKAPTVTSTDYPNDNTWHKDKNQAGDFLLAPPAPYDKSLKGYRYSLDKPIDPSQPPLAAVAYPLKTTLKITPPSAGRHVLRVQSVDLAGNTSAVVEYVFHVGRAGILTPENNARVASRARLFVTGEEAFTYVRFESRRAPDPTSTITPVASSFLTTADGTPWPTGGTTPVWMALPKVTTGEPGYTTWNVGDQIGAVGGPIQVRPVVATDANGAGAYTGEWVTLTVDRDATGAATTAVGPGAVNLLTGDHTLSATDASEYGLMIQRTTSSRDTDSGYRLQAERFTKGQVEGTDTVGVETNSAQVGVATEKFHTGTSSLKVVAGTSGSDDSFAAPGGGNGAMRLGMRPGRTYRVSGWIYVPAGTTLSPTNSRGLRIAAAVQTPRGYEVPTSAQATVVDAWQELSLDVTIPTDATSASIRLYNGFAPSTGKAVYFDDLSARELWAPFGKQWSTGTIDAVAGTDYTHISMPQPDVATVSFASGGKIWFTSGNGTQWWPEIGAEAFNLTVLARDTTTQKPTSFRVTESDGTVTDFAQEHPGQGDYQVQTTAPPGVVGASRQVYDIKGVTGLARLSRIIAPIEEGVDGWPANTNACNPAPALPPQPGCRVLDITYAPTTTTPPTGTALGAYPGQVTEVTAWGTDPGSTMTTPKTVARYLYDSQGRLRSVWDPRIGTSTATGPGADTLVTKYTYDDDGRVTQVTAPGVEPYRFTYGKAGSKVTGTGDFLDNSTGRLTKVTRSSLVDGADNVSTLVYDVPLTTAKGGPYDLGAAHLATWAQTDGPTDATAVFGPEQVPTVTTADATTPGPGGYRLATVHYLNADGREVNTATPTVALPGKSAPPAEGFIDTAEYDRFGNVVRTLDATNRLTALKVLQPADLPSWGLPATTSADLAQLLDSRNIYSTDGLNLLASRGPAQRLAVANNADTMATLFPVTRYAYDEGKPDGASYRLQTSQVTGAIQAGLGGDLLTATLLDPLVTRTEYSPLDGKDPLDPSSGWVHKKPTRVTVDVGGANAVTTTLYDDRGRTTKVVPPGSTGEDAATTLMTYYSSTANGDLPGCGNKPQWAGNPCLTQAAADITGHDPARMGAQLPVRQVTEYNRSDSPTVVKETVGSTAPARVTVTTYDGANRTTSVETTGGLGTALPKVTTEYHAATGQVATTKTGAGTGTAAVAREYDTLGRLTKYTDASGAWTATAYDRYGKTTKVTTSLGTSTEYGYDLTTEPRGLATSITDSVGGTIRPTWGPDGQLESQQLPGGVTMKITYDAARVPTARTYTVPGQTAPLQSDSVIENNRGQWVRHTTNALGGQLGTQDYTYDNLGRLTDVKDANPAAATCTWRSYTFDARGSRTDQRTTVDPWTPPTPGEPATTAGCTRNPTTTQQSATAFSSVHTDNDTADRLVSTDTHDGDTWTYDAFGRVATFPNADGSGTVTNTFYANDLIAAQRAGTTSVSWALDPLQRRMTYTRQDGTAAAVSKTSYYGDDTDNPAWIKEGTASDAPITRFLGGADGQAIMSTTKTGGRKLVLTDLHGDVVTTVPLVDGAGVDTSGIRHHTYDEFGNARAIGGTVAPAGRYGWLGAHERSTEALGGVMLMGVRLYSASVGRFFSVDSVPGGNTTPYNYPQDPINTFDLDGKKARKGIDDRSPGHSWRKLWRETKRATNFLWRVQRTNWRLMWEYRDVVIGVAAVTTCIIATGGVCAAVSGVAIGANFADQVWIRKTDPKVALRNAAMNAALTTVSYGFARVSVGAFSRKMELTMNTHWTMPTMFCTAARKC